MVTLRTGSYANIVSTAALVLALGGTAYAATVVTSAQIKDGTIQTRDLAPRARTAAYDVAQASTLDLHLDGSMTTVLTLRVPTPGSYVLSATLIADNSNAAGVLADVSCAIRTRAWVGAAGARLSSEGANQSTLALQGSYRFPAAGTARLRCISSSPSVGFTTPVHVAGADLMATRVAATSHHTA